MHGDDAVVAWLALDDAYPCNPGEPLAHTVSVYERVIVIIFGLNDHPVGSIACSLCCFCHTVSIWFITLLLCFPTLVPLCSDMVHVLPTAVVVWFMPLLHVYISLASVQAPLSVDWIRMLESH